MTYFCTLCGWLVLDGGPCKRDGGPSVEWRAAVRACRVPSLFRLLNLEPELRVELIELDRARFLENGRRHRRRRPDELEVAS